MMDAKKKYVVLEPMKKPVDSVLAPCYPYSAYCALICEIPYGMIATDKDLMDCLGKAYGIDGLEVEDVWSESRDKSNAIYPYWRIVSERGHLLNSKGKEDPNNPLRKEGHEIYQPSPERDSYVVRDYSNKKFDFSCLNISVRTDPKDYVKGFCSSDE